MKILPAVLSALILVACGGSGSGGSDVPASSTSGLSPFVPLFGSSTSGLPPSAVSLANETPEKYHGMWREDCDSLLPMRTTKTFTPTGGATFSVFTREEYFDNADCTGTPVASGSYDQPDENVTYWKTSAGVSVTLLTGETIKDDVDPATSVLAGSPLLPIHFIFSGVTSTSSGGKTSATIKLADRTSKVIVRPDLIGQSTVGALLLRNDDDELLTLVPIDSTMSFKVNHRYIRFN